MLSSKEDVKWPERLQPLHVCYEIVDLVFTRCYVATVVWQEISWCDPLCWWLVGDYGVMETISFLQTSSYRLITLFERSKALSLFLWIKNKSKNLGLDWAKWMSALSSGLLAGLSASFI
ncbi:hypothetical protein HanXRQr2_Chr04g0186801 [Helianthus annuus]|uniref:Uncharacterized protein n=1 Tax=Helianthus annuus TaxID=4232 RepID=A0A9K3NTB9_HELAN|nr:hypothetical protein HanXRQr2_Chr04g0186801 [Helianthus annuus]